MNPLIKLIQEVENEKIETHSAPSGEWAEYNIETLISEARLEGIQEAQQAIGDCSKCEHFNTEKREKDYCFCKLTYRPKNDTDYCSDFEEVL